MRLRAAVLASARERHSLARLLSLVALGLLVAAVPARAQGTLDQQQSELGRANPAVHSGMSLAQTFTPAAAVSSTRSICDSSGPGPRGPI
jgi:hypothetical protein